MIPYFKAIETSFTLLKACDVLFRVQGVWVNSSLTAFSLNNTFCCVFSLNSLIKSQHSVPHVTTSRAHSWAGRTLICCRCGLPGSWAMVAMTVLLLG